MSSLRHWLSPGTLDDARAAIQPAAVEALLEGYQLDGRCLNAGSGEGLFAGVIDRQPRIVTAVDLDLGRPRVWAVRRLLPRALLSTLGRLDAILRLGRPWDLVVVARRLQSSVFSLQSLVFSL